LGILSAIDKSVIESYGYWKVEYGMPDIKDDEVAMLNKEEKSLNNINEHDPDGQKYPFGKYLAFLLILGVLLIIILIGGGSDASVIGIQCGSLIYWGIYVCAVPLMVMFTAVAGWWLRREQKKNKYEKIGDKSEKKKNIYHVPWNLKNLIFWPGVGVFAGFSAALVGIGGGSIQGPVLLAMGLSPHVTVVTSAFMITFTAIANIIQYFMLNLLTWEQAIWYSAVGLVGAVAGHNVVGFIVEKWKKQFFCVVFVVDYDFGEL